MPQEQDTIEPPVQPKKKGLWERIPRTLGWGAKATGDAASATAAAAADTALLAAKTAGKAKKVIVETTGNAGETVKTATAKVGKAVGDGIDRAGENIHKGRQVWRDEFNKGMDKQTNFVSDAEAKGLSSAFKAKNPQVLRALMVEAGVQGANNNGELSEAQLDTLVAQAKEGAGVTAVSTGGLGSMAGYGLLGAAAGSTLGLFKDVKKDSKSSFKSMLIGGAVGAGLAILMTGGLAIIPMALLGMMAGYMTKSVSGGAMGLVGGMAGAAFLPKLLGKHKQFDDPLRAQFREAARRGHVNAKALGKVPQQTQGPAPDGPGGPSAGPSGPGPDAPSPVPPTPPSAAAEAAAPVNPNDMAEEKPPEVAAKPINVGVSYDAPPANAFTLSRDAIKGITALNVNDNILGGGEKVAIGDAAPGLSKNVNEQAALAKREDNQV